MVSPLLPAQATLLRIIEEAEVFAGLSPADRGTAGEGGLLLAGRAVGAWSAIVIRAAISPA